MSIEHGTARQYDMFTGEIVDNRSQSQKKRDNEREAPSQLEMFAAREMAQFGVNARPLIPLSPHTRLTLWAEDPRTEEEIARDRQRAAEEDTYPLFEPECRALVVRGVVALTVYQPQAWLSLVLGGSHES